MERFLAGRVAMVTGGASGMGRAMALAFAEAGAKVAIGSLLADGEDRVVDGELVNLPASDELEATRAELEALDVPCLAMDLDVTRDESVDRFFDRTLAELGGVDILANAAGITAEHATCGHPDPLWMKVVEVNLHGTYRTVKRALPGMMERRWGRIINIASTAASVGAPKSAAYCASKAAVVGFTRCVALEGAPYGVAANTISPGWVDTRFGKDWMAHIATTDEGKSGEAYIEETKQQNPQRRMIQPREIGALAQFLCREEALGVTMQDLTVSAGSLW